MTTELIDPRLSQHAERIHSLLIDVARNGLALGTELAKARKHFMSLPKKVKPAATWEKWLYQEFKISKGWAGLLMRAALGVQKGPAYLREQAPEVVALLTSKPSRGVPPEAIAEIKGHIEKGGKITRKKARGIVRKHRNKGKQAKLPSPSEAKEIAAKHGTLVAASDGRLYTGASEEAVKLAEDRRAVVYGIREAIDIIAQVAARMSAEEFLKFADPHQLWREGEDGDIAPAANWLDGLVRAWQKRKVVEAA